MNRRQFLFLLPGGMITAAAVRAQQKAMPVIGFLSAGSPGPLLAAFLRGLGEAGWVEGKNVTVEYRWAEGHYDRLPGLAADLVSRNVEIIVTTGGAASALAAKDATVTIPIVFSAADPVGSGLVASLARPGDNLTGFRILTTELTPKRLELLCELAPQARGVALLVNPINPVTEPLIRVVQEAADAKRVQLRILYCASANEIEAAFAALVEPHPSALVVGADPFFFSRREQLVALAAHHAVPAIYFEREFVTGGGLISYGMSFTANGRDLATYAGRILNGAKPADLPVQQPATFELVINLNTAKALGLTIPPAILARADEVIE